MLNDVLDQWGLTEAPEDGEALIWGKTMRSYKLKKST